MRQTRRMSKPQSPADAGYLFSRSAAVLGSSNVSTPKTRELSVISPALKPAAPGDGRTPLNRYPRDGERMSKLKRADTAVAASPPSNLEATLPAPLRPGPARKD